MKNHHLENRGACGVALQFCNSVLNSRAERVFDISSHFNNHKGAKKLLNSNHKIILPGTQNVQSCWSSKGSTNRHKLVGTKLFAAT